VNRWPLIVAFLLTVPAIARIHPVSHPGAVPEPQSVLWIGAHPDDEAAAAPLLAHWCRDHGARCTFLILTRGDAGQCRKSDGCAPDLASVRSAEEGSASQYFGAVLILLNLPDGGGASPPVWPHDLPATIAKYIDAVQPELILTFDPRHGTTCHPDHRAAADAVLQAIPLLTTHPSVYLLETRVVISADPLSIQFRPATDAALRFDAGNAAWNAIAADMQRHPSQFDGALIAAVQSVPVVDRAVYIAPANVVMREAVDGCH